MAILGREGPSLDCYIDDVETRTQLSAYNVIFNMAHILLFPHEDIEELIFMVNLNGEKVTANRDDTLTTLRDYNPRRVLVVPRERHELAGAWRRERGMFLDLDGTIPVLRLDFQVNV